MKSFELLLIKSLILMITVSFNMPHSMFSQEKPKEKKETVKVVISKTNGEVIIDTIYILQAGEVDAINLKEEINKIIDLEFLGKEGKESLKDIYISVATDGQLRGDTAVKKNIMVWTAVEKDGGETTLGLKFGDEDRDIIVYDADDTTLKNIQKRIVLKSKTDTWNMIYMDDDEENESIWMFDGDGNKHAIIIHTLTYSNIEDEDKEVLEIAGIKIPEEQLELEGLSFFPNPNDGEFTLSFSVEEKGQLIIKVLDIQGKVVHQEIYDNFTGKYNKKINIKENSKGTYFLVIQHGKELAAHKIIYK